MENILWYNLPQHEIPFFLAGFTEHWTQHISFDIKQRLIWKPLLTYPWCLWWHYRHWKRKIHPENKMKSRKRVYRISTLTFGTQPTCKQGRIFPTYTWNFRIQFQISLLIDKYILYFWQFQIPEIQTFHFGIVTLHMQYAMYLLSFYYISSNQTRNGSNMNIMRKIHIRLAAS